jgi:cyclophilin family peptidyl-prolyl cis-trans isomerase
MLAIISAEDERRWDEAELGKLLSDASPAVRRRAALAAGRIGDEGAVAPLAALLARERDEGVRATAAFALGEVESGAGADALLEVLRLSKAPEMRARAVEALGKITAALPEAQTERRRQLGEAILNTLAAEGRQPRPDRQLLLLAITAALRAKPEGAGRAVAPFLSSPDSRVRADAANTLARLRAKEASQRLRFLLSTDADPVVRANAARALGAAEDAAALEALLYQSKADADVRVRVSAVRALAQLKDANAGEPLTKRGEEVLAAYKAAKANGVANPAEVNELLELATAVGRLWAGQNNERAVALLRGMREAGVAAAEVETALARVAPTQYVRERALADFVNRTTSFKDPNASWQKVSAVGQGLGELSALTSATVGNSAVGLQADAQILLRSLIESPNTPALAVPDLLRALAGFKPPDLAAVARARLKADDVIVRATAADLLSELPPEAETARALVEALPRSLHDETNDAALSVLGALARQQGGETNDAIKSALEVTDYLVRRRAADILRERGAASDKRIETVNTRNHRADYERALARVGRGVRALVATDKGLFTIELLPSEAPLAVDNFVELARKGYFNNVAFHRVVPNFVVQGGDPRGDGNGGPGYQIRCEINTVPYARGAVGMALSGKDTGGSQWFVTHSPQPHLDGGYTVFGNVTQGMDVVDRIARGDRIRSVQIVEGKVPAPPRTQRATGQ